MKRGILPILLFCCAVTSCETLTKMGLNPNEERYQENATVIKAGAVTYDDGVDNIGKGKGKAIVQNLTSGYSQTIVIRTDSGKTFTRKVTLGSSGNNAYSTGDTGIAEIGKISNTCWAFGQN